MVSTLTASLIHWKKKLERTTDEEAILNTVHKLSKVPITMELLQDTGIGKVMRSLAKRSGMIGSKSSSVLLKWRDVVAASQKTSKHEHKKQHSHKKEISNGAREHADKSETQLKSSLEKSRKPNHSSDLKGKQNHVNGKTHHSSSNKLNSVKEECQNSYDYDSENSFKNDVEPNKNFQKQTNSKILDEKRVKKEKVYEKTSKKESSLFENDIPTDKKRKHDLTEDVDDVADKRREKHKLSRESDSPSNLYKKEVNGSTSKKDKNKTSPKHTEDTKHSSKHKSEHKHVKSKREKESKKKHKSKSDLEIKPTEAFTSSEVRFEDCLGFNDVVPVKKKKSSKSSAEKVKKSSSKEKSSSTHVDNHNPVSKEKQTKEMASFPEVPKLLREQLPVLAEVDIFSTLPQTQPTYRPLPHRSYDSSPKKKVLSNEEAIKFTSSRREKTSVYSGKKTFFTEVPTLLDCCIRVLIDNIDAIEYMGEAVPYFILKQVLVKCTAPQLLNIEDFNPYILEETQELWEVHCKKDFRHLKPQENETWRDLYWRAVEEREKKFKNITANISASMSTKYKPGRQVQLAYVDSVVKPPRDVARKQAKNGTGLRVNHTVKTAQPLKPTVKPMAAVKNTVVSPPPPPKEIIPKKPKVAPLMAKTLKSMKQCFRR